MQIADNGLIKYNRLSNDVNLYLYKLTKNIFYLVKQFFCRLNKYLHSFLFGEYPISVAYCTWLYTFLKEFVNK